MDSVHPAEQIKTAFELVLLGPPTLRDGNGQIPVGLGSGKPLALLCFLVVRGEVRRDEALALLWGDVDEDRARNAFRQALHRLRLALGEDLLVGDRQNLKAVVGDRLRADVLQFESAYDEGRFDAGIALYRGDFLDGFEVGSSAFDEWAAFERTRLRSRCQSLAERAVQRALVDGRLGDAEAAVRKLLAVAPLDPRAIEVAAAAFVSMGRRSEAEGILQDFRRHSSDELGVALPQALQVMLDRISPSPNETHVADSVRERTLVGRSSELAKLLAMWNALSDDAGGTVVIEGPAGIGKSRLVREFSDGVRALGAVHMLHAVEGPRGYTLPYGAIASALRPLVRAAGVAGASPHLLAEAARILPELRDAFQLPAVDASEQDTGRLRVSEGIAALIESAAYERPICLVLEDLHRATATTLDLLSYLAPRLRRARVLLVLTFSTEGASRDVTSRLRSLAGRAIPGGGSAEGETYTISLDSLAPAETRALAAQILGAAARPETLERITERAGGNPLRAIELARLAADGVEPTSLPVRIGDIARDRIEACSTNERRLFLVAALLSRPAPLRLLAEASHVPAAAAGDATQSLLRRGLLVEEGSHLAPTSEAAAEAALGLAGEATTAFVAGWVAEVLAREPDAAPAELVRLFGQAGRSAETHKFARAGAERAMARGAVEESIHFLTIARAFARTQREHEAIEGLLTVHGAGRPQLPGGSASSSPSGVRAPAGLVRYFPHWRLLTAAAIAASVIAIVVTASTPSRGFSAVATSDTLVVAKAREARRGLVHLVTGDAAGLRVSGAVARRGSSPAWADSMSLPWVNALASPTGRFVGVERITPEGSNVYLIAVDRRDTIPLVVGENESFGMGWSPDGEWFLATRRLNERGDAGLYAFSISRDRAPVAIDTSANHSVIEAAWSPDGSRIAWVARVGGRQEEVFVSWADGSERRNLSAHPAQDDRVAWSADGSLLAFTSRRDGNAELYAYDMLNDRLWRLTRNEAHDDRAMFAGDGRLVAFESTRGGASDVYVMPSLGGAVSRVGDSTSSYEIIGWRQSGSRYLDRLELGVPESIRRGDTLTLRVRGLDQFGAPMSPWDTRWSVIDQSLLRSQEQDAQTASPLEQRFVALNDGLARIEVTAGAWRTDTAYVSIGDGPVSLLRDYFGSASLSPTWLALGQPSPTVGTLGGRPALLMNADRQWESGVLCRSSLPLRAGLSVEATLLAPFQVHAAATTASLALVAPDPPDAIDHEAPRFLRLISITWNADARRLIYAAEREVFVEAVPEGQRDNVRTVAILVSANGTVGFFVDGVRRWQSTLRVVRADRASRAQIWLGGHDTGSRVGFANVSASLAGPSPERR